jgi:hypothetical protein
MKAMEEANEYMDTLKDNISKQQIDLRLMKESYEHYQQLASVEKAKADAFLAQLAQQVDKSVKSERTWAFVLGVVSNLVVVFILGVLASDPVKARWRWLWAKL